MGSGTAAVADYPNITALPSAYPAAAQNGAVSGGVLRPGAIDQSQFQKLLQARYQAQNQGKSAAAPVGMTLSDYRKLAGIQVMPGAVIVDPSTPASPSLPMQGAATSAPRPAPPSDGIPTLSLEQFAALTGMPSPEATPAPPPMAANAVNPVVALATSEVETADAAPLDALAGEEAAAPDGVVDGVPVIPATDEPDSASSTANPRVVLLDTYPDREEQRSIAAQGKTWRMKETPGAKELFLGPDGEFGWDDFIDIINPLQHIPVVAQIYRAVTGDQAYGLSNFIGAAPFGPISVASAIVDTVIRSQTGRDAGTDMAARVLGIDNRTPEEADLHLVRDGQDQMAALPSGDAGVGAAATQVADASMAPEAAATWAWTRDSAGIGRD